MRRLFAGLLYAGREYLGRLFGVGGAVVIGHSVCGIPNLAGRVSATVGLRSPVEAHAQLGARVTATMRLTVCEE